MNTNKEDCVDCGDGPSTAEFPFGSQGKPKNRQEENWALMTVLQIPWHHADEINKDEDREFLLEKATVVEAYLQQQQKQQQQQQMQQQAMQMQHQQIQQQPQQGMAQGMQPQMQPQMQQQPAAPVSVSPNVSPMGNQPQVEGPFVVPPSSATNVMS